MGWITFKDNKPTRLVIAMVANVNAWMAPVQATYYPERDAWVLNDPNYRHSLALDVTHYLEIPHLKLAAPDWKMSLNPDG